MRRAEGRVKLSSYLFQPLQGTNHCSPNGPITLQPPNSNSALETPEGESRELTFNGILRWIRLLLQVPLGTACQKELQKSC